MFVVTRTDFDILENSIGKARIHNIVGYTETEADALEYISKQSRYTHKGWDGELYPQYTCKKYENLTNLCTEEVEE